MPDSNRAITAPVREALLECFEAAVNLVSKDVRNQLVLVRGAASIVHGGT